MSKFEKKDLFWPTIIIIIGVYYCLKNIFNIDILGYLDFSFNHIWPVAILVYGVHIFIKNYKK